MKILTKSIMLIFLIKLLGCAVGTSGRYSSTSKIEDKRSIESSIIEKRIKPPRNVYCIEEEIESEYQEVKDSFNIREFEWKDLIVRTIKLNWLDSLEIHFEGNGYYYWYEKSTFYNTYATEDSTYHKASSVLYCHRFPKTAFTNQAPPVINKKWVNTEELNIRGKPGVDHKIIGKLKRGYHKVDYVYAVEDKNPDWEKILLPYRNWNDSTSYGWVYSKFVSDSESEANSIYRKKKEQEEMERRRRIIAKKKKEYRKKGWSEKVIDAILNNKVSIGMTEEQAIESWGYPDDINRSVGSWGEHEQWVYEKGDFENIYLYFENGRLTSWQE